jgi:hypothetical protein
MLFAHGLSASVVYRGILKPQVADQNGWMVRL